MKAKTLKHFLQNIPDEAEVAFDKNIVTFIYNDNTVALNVFGAVWENGTAFAPDGTSFCGECSTFQCDKCGNYKNKNKD